VKTATAALRPPLEAERKPEIGAILAIAERIPSTGRSAEQGGGSPEGSWLYVADRSAPA
jgi:hypothetical protein